MATVVFFPEGAYGPTNNCVGIGDVLRRRGHRVVFVVEKSFAGTLEEKGFEEAAMLLGPPPEQEEEPGQFWKDFIRETAPVFRKPTIEQLVDDNVASFPALPASGRPWVRITSCNPVELKDADVPPAFSGYPSADRSGWPEYWDEYR